MSCQLCEFYAGVGFYCLNGHLVYDAHISIACDDYQYNQELRMNDTEQ